MSAGPIPAAYEARCWPLSAPAPGPIASMSRGALAGAGAGASTGCPWGTAPRFWGAWGLLSAGKPDVLGEAPKPQVPRAKPWGWAGAGGRAPASACERACVHPIPSGHLGHLLKRTQNHTYIVGKAVVSAAPGVPQGCPESAQDAPARAAYRPETATLDGGVTALRARNVQRAANHARDSHLGTNYARRNTPRHWGPPNSLAGLIARWSLFNAPESSPRENTRTVCANSYAETQVCA